MKIKSSYIKNLFWSIKEIRRFSRNHLILLYLNSIAEGMLPVLLLGATQNMINKLQQGNNYWIEAIIWFTIVMCIGLFEDLLGSFLNLKLESYEKNFDIHIQEKIFSKIAKLKCRDFEKSYVHDMVNRTQYDSNASILENAKIFFSVISLTLSLFSYTVILGKYSKLTTIILYILPCVRFFYEKKYNLEEYNFTKKRTNDMRKTAYLSSLLTDAEYFKELKIFNLFETLIGEYQSIKKGYTKKLLELKKKRTVVYAIINLGSVVIEFGILLKIISKVLIGDILIGKFIMLNGAINNLNQNVISLLSRVSFLYRNAVIIEDLKHFFNMEEERNIDSGIVIKEIQEIEFKNVSYRYSVGSEYVLKNINLTLKQGCRYILIGENGAGKTTLSKIILGLYDDYEGNVYINGIDMKSINMLEYRKMVSVLFQDYIKFETTIDNNICYGKIFNKKRNVTSSEILEQVGLVTLEKIKNVQLGNQFLGGRQFSIGQWQRVALGRALAKEADIYLLDEPNASLDVISENKVITSIFNKDTSKIKILICHRFYRFANIADELLFLSEGTIIARGNHSHMLSMCPKYKELYDLQQAMGKEEE